MTKILHVAETIQGGVGTILSSIASSSKQCKLKLDCMLLVPFSQSQSLSGNLPSNVEVVYFGGRTRFARLFFLFFKLLVLPRIFRPDVVHLHSTFAGLLYRTFFSYRNALIVYQPHGVSFDKDRSKGLKRAAIMAVERFLAKGTHVIIAISQYEASQIYAAGIRSKTVVIENGVDRSTWPINFDRSARDGYLFIGRFDNQKGLDLLISYWLTSSRPEKLYLAGEPVLDSGSAFNAASEKIIKLGWLTGSELDRVMSGVLAVIVPSRWEGFGLVVAEAFRNATPVIVSDRGALPFLVVTGDTGYVFELDKFDESLTKSLEEFGDSDWFRLSCKAYATFQQRFLRERMLAEIYRLYVNLVGTNLPD